MTVRNSTITAETLNPAVWATTIAAGSATLEVTGNSRIENTGTGPGISVMGFSPRSGVVGATGNLALTLAEGSTVTARSAGNQAAVLAQHQHIGTLTVRSAGDVTNRGMGFGVVGISTSANNRALLDVEVTGGMINSPRVGLWAEHRGTGNIRAVMSAGAITTSTTGVLGSGILARAFNTDQTMSRTVDVLLSGGSVTTTGDSATGVYGQHYGQGNLNVSLMGGMVNTTGTVSTGVIGFHAGTGNVTVTAAAGRVETTGDRAHGVLSAHTGTSGRAAASVLSGASVQATGAGSHGIALSSAADAMSTATINGMVTGGSGAGRGILFSNGGIVTVGPGGLLRAESGIAIQSVAGSLMVNVLEGGQIGRDGMDNQRIQGSEDAGDTTTITVRGVTLVEDNMPTGRAVNVMHGVMDRGLQLLTEAQMPDSMDCGARCWRWLLGEPVADVTTRALALEVLPQALLGLTRPVRTGRQGDYETAETGPWFDLSGHYGSYQPASASTHSNYEQQWFRAEGGFQGILPQFTRDGCKTLMGLSAHYLNSSTNDIRGVGAPGAEAEMDATGAGFGLHLSWHDVRGFYARAEGRATWYDGSLVAEGMRPEIGGAGWSLSVSGGRSLSWSRWPGVVLTPQAQLSWAEVGVDQMTVPFVASFDRSRSVRARVGLGVEHEGVWREAVTLLQATGSVEHEFDGETLVVTEPDDTRLAARSERVWGVLSLGASLTGEGGVGPLAGLGAEEYKLSARLEGALGASGNYEATISAGLSLRF